MTAERYVPDPTTHLTHVTRPPGHHGHYWACEYPERPPSPGVEWSHLCRACLVHSAAVIANDPAAGNLTVYFAATTTSRPRPVRHADLVAYLAELVGDELIGALAGGDPNRAKAALGA